MLTIEASEVLPLLLFISIGAMIAAVLLGFDLKDAASHRHHRRGGWPDVDPCFTGLTL